jgi:hypothetical protein
MCAFCVALFPWRKARRADAKAWSCGTSPGGVDREIRAGGSAFRELGIEFEEADHGIAQSVYIPTRMGTG